MRMDLTEEQTNLIREHMHLMIVIEELKKQLTKGNDIYKHIVIITGKFQHARLQVVKDELRKMGIHTWHEVQDDMVYITVACRGVKERFGLKRKIVDEDVQKMMDGFADWIESHPIPREPYKPDVRPPIVEFNTPLD